MFPAQVGHISRIALVLGKTTPGKTKMDLTMINDAARAVHLLGLALGFGVAIMADLSASRLLVRPLDAREVDTLHGYHRTVALGLTLFWASGLPVDVQYASAGPHPDWLP